MLLQQNNQTNIAYPKETEMALLPFNGRFLSEYKSASFSRTDSPTPPAPEKNLCGLITHHIIEGGNAITFVRPSICFHSIFETD